VAKAKDHLKSAEEVYSLCRKEYEEGRRKGDLTRMREGCEKIFHGERWEILDKLGQRKLVETATQPFSIFISMAITEERCVPRKNHEGCERSHRLCAQRSSPRILEIKTN